MLFRSSGLDNNCLYTIRVANWDSATSLYAVTNVTPVLVFPANSVHGTGDEWGELTLLAPEGKVFSSVVFASYGMPVNYTINSECHADATQLVAAVFIGNETGTVQVTNVDLTGDPCYGVSKHLSVILLYEDKPVPVLPPVVPPVDTGTVNQIGRAHV